jgi:hypothetical protein
VIVNLRRAEAGLIAELARVDAERARLGGDLRDVRAALRALGQAPDGTDAVPARGRPAGPVPGSRNNLNRVAAALREIGEPVTLGELRKSPSLRGLNHNSVRWALQRLRKDGRAAIVNDVVHGLGARWQLTSDP